MTDSQIISRSVLIVDDHPIICDSLIFPLNKYNMFRNIYTSDSLKKAMDLLDSDKNVALIILDLNLSDSEGIETIQVLRESYPNIPVIIFSGEESEEVITKAFEYGVRGYVPKSYRVPIILSAIDIVLAGGCFLPKEIAYKLGISSQLFSVTNTVHEIETPHFSPKQSQVLNYLLDGLLNKTIGDRLNMKENTVKSHVSTIYHILGVRNRAQAVRKAQKLGMI